MLGLVLGGEGSSPENEAPKRSGPPEGFEAEIRAALPGLKLDETNIRAFYRAFCLVARPDEYDDEE